MSSSSSISGADIQEDTPGLMHETPEPQTGCLQKQPITTLLTSQSFNFNANRLSPISKPSGQLCLNGM